MRTIRSVQILTTVLMLVDVAAIAQSGPGGIGNANTNILWLSGDHGIVAPMAGVSQWTDRSGNANHATQSEAARQPVIIPNAMNGYPAVLFDNDQVHPDRLTIPDNSTLEGMSGLTGFVAFRLNPGTPIGAPRGFLSKRLNPGSQNAYAWFLWQNGGNLRQHLDIDGTGDRASSGDHFIANANYVNSFLYHGATPSNANDQLLFTGNVQVGNRRETSTSIPNYSSDLHIGTLFGHTGSGDNTARFNGYIAELILYAETLNPVQHLIVNNYLAAKYGTTLGAGDLYTMDEPDNGNYDHEVAGIGRSGGNVVDGSQGTGIVSMRRSSGSIANNTYLLWGHDNGALGSWGVSGIHSSLQGRLERIWRVSEVNATGDPANVGNVDITFDLSGLGPTNAADLRLIVDLNDDGDINNDLPISGATDLGNGLFRFSNISAIVHARRFTLGTVNILTTPLPVELMAFNAQAASNAVLLEWATASETGSDRFDLERSNDAHAWIKIGSVPAAHYSASVIHYDFTDLLPLPGTSYYRLMQVDVDGSTTYSDIVPVFRSNRSSVSIHPMPFSDHFIITQTGGPPLEITLIDAAGRPVRPLWTGLDDGARVDAGKFAPGRYILHVRYEDRSITEQVIKMH